MLNFKCLEKLAKKSPALARFVEGIIHWSGLTLITAVVGAIITLLEGGTSFEEFKLTIIASITAFAISVLKSGLMAYTKRSRDRLKKLEK